MGVKELLARLFRSKHQRTSQTILFAELDGWLSSKAADLIAPCSFVERGQKYFSTFFLQLTDLGPAIANSSAASTELYTIYSRLQGSTEKPVQWQEILALHRRVNDDFQELFNSFERLDDNNNILLRAKIEELAERIHEFDAFARQSRLPVLLTLGKHKERIEFFDLEMRRQSAVIVNRKERLAFARQHFLEKREELDTLEGDPLYVLVHIYEKQKRELAGQKEEVEKMIVDHFTLLHPFLSRYLELEHAPDYHSIIFEYLQKPVSSLISDEGLQIAHVLEHIAAAVRVGKVPGNAGELDYLLLELRRVDLTDLQQRAITLDHQLAVLDGPIVDAAFLTRLEDVRYRFSHFAEQVERGEKELEQIYSQQQDYVEMKAREIVLFENIVKNCFDDDIKIVP